MNLVTTSDAVIEEYIQMTHQIHAMTQEYNARRMEDAKRIKELESMLKSGYSSDSDEMSIDLDREIRRLAALRLGMVPKHQTTQSEEIQALRRTIKNLEQMVSSLQTQITQLTQ